MLIKKIPLLGLMLAIILVLTTLEATLTPLLPLHTKPGLANVVVMFCLFSLGRREAVLLNVLKSLFVLITRGPMAGLLSLCGGLLSIAVIIALSSKKQSYSFISVSGAVTHNLGQVTIAAIIMSTPLIFYYLPTLIISGLLTGLLTATLLKTLLATKMSKKQPPQE